ncbi:hypothetical protein [Streptomyces sp. SID13031]|uniref:hypothetical protein n=1 Tax=Streptomyces sp. SID13031 TaxID=2706046 RepID=UPI0013C8B554|nr:hypothetical protein [Streptomyces sp. SID13031]NEA33006.1 hypothetical protein [Streptomyces sp. SID13031]
MPDEPNRPFRWDLVRPDQLGSLLDGDEPTGLYRLDDLVQCAGRVLAHSGGGDLYFVGRSVDSWFDLLSGALAATSWKDRLHQVPLSLFGMDGRGFTSEELRQLRTNLAADGLAPADLMRGRPTVFVDLVFRGSTFGNLYAILRDWIDEESAQWDVIRRQLRFVGITSREKTSPNTWRWQQQATWTAELPPAAIRNVSLDLRIWEYFGDHQPKTADSFRRTRWRDPTVATPKRDDAARAALRQAVWLVEQGRSVPSRQKLAAQLAKEPSARERWSRDLQLELRR